ncbi:MAG: FtsW/RodA/SpoVE family cell cycle protein [Candidatus Aminicenantes bacterium]|nr:FtsW/RodA/SpoVE family cell cycle protein [Candidatus Aminicenantes bacterium]NIM82951.1 FtsW/RodA/SpoVE family cell cycle protein [Candidatus Aminicenantes bacterium]NIN22328.1 FtsW/RodA/SpoVE family cell cycle protein [Candidatus Aminicenantes bacterium]NIN46096.1 FtsW/RodA/SpoVE family cell cycle protein [Candidatus Aminicenantes bacterium]NIN88932.1 FtsW/RodA/SpoVE family cell cycle protein [Candidatus Aminicenantes bacterium]
MENIIQPVFYISWALWLVYSFIILLLSRRRPHPQKVIPAMTGMLLSTIAVFSFFFLLVRDFKSGSIFFIENYQYRVDGKQEEIIIGSSKEESDITLENPAAAKRHLKIILHEKDFSVQNISEDKNVDVNGRYLDQTLLREGDEIEINGKKKLKIMKINRQYPMGRSLTVSVTGQGEKQRQQVLTEIHTLLNKSVGLPLPDTPRTPVSLTYEPHTRFMGANIYYVIVFFMIFLLSFAIYLYLKNRFNGALLLLMMASLPFGAGFLPTRLQGVMVLLFLPFIVYVERKRKTQWKWGSIVVLVLYGAVFFLPGLLRLDGNFILSRTGFSKDAPASVRVNRGQNSFELFAEQRKLVYGRTHRVILGHTLYSLYVDKTGVDFPVITLSPRDPEKIAISQNYNAIISDLKEVKPGNNYIYLKFPHDFPPIPANTISTGGKITVKDKSGNSLTLSKAANKNYRFYLFGLIFLIIVPFWVFLIFASGGQGGAFYKNCPPGPPAKIFYMRKGHGNTRQASSPIGTFNSFVVYNFVYFMLALGYVMFGALALYDNSYFKNFSKFRNSALPLFVVLFLGFLLLSRYNRFLVFLYRVFRQKMYHIPFLIALILVLAANYSLVFLIFGGGYFIYVFGFRLRRGIAHEYKNAHSYPLDIKKIIETPVCSFETRENKRLFFGLGGILNKRGWNCLLIADLLLLLALFFIVLQLFLGGEVGVSFGGFFFLPIELGKILLTIYFADWISRIDKGMKFNVLWVYGLVLVPFLLLIVFLKDFAPLIVFAFVFFYHIIKIKKTILFRVFLIGSGLVLLWLAARSLGNYTFPFRLFAIIFSIPLLHILLRVWHKKKSPGSSGLFIAKKLLLVLVLISLLVVVNYTAFTRHLPVPRVLADRVSTWLNPWQDYNLSYQYINSLWLMKGTGTFGRSADALTAAAQVPLIEKDLTFALVVGGLGTAGAALLFLTLFLTAAVVFRQTASQWHCYVLEFLAVIFAAQFLVPAMYAVGLLPLMGQPLPFLSYSNNMLLLFVLPFSFLMIILSNQHSMKTMGTNGPNEVTQNGRANKKFLHFKLFFLIAGVIVVLIFLRLYSVSYPKDVEEKTDIVFLEGFRDYGSMFKINLASDRFCLTPFIDRLKVGGKEIAAEVEIDNEDIILVEDRKFQFKVYPARCTYKEVFCRPLRQIFPTRNTVKYIGGWITPDRRQVLADSRNRDLLKKIIVEIGPEELKKLVPVPGTGKNPALLLELRGDLKSLRVRSLSGDITRIRHWEEKKIEKNTFISIVAGDILKFDPAGPGSDAAAGLYLKFDFRSFEGARGFSISHKQKDDSPFAQKPESAVLKSLNTDITYGISLKTGTLFIGESGLFSFNLKPADLLNKLYIPDKMPHLQQKHARRPGFKTIKTPRKPAIFDAGQNILAFTSEINGNYRRFYSSEVSPDLLYLLGSKSEETWGLEQIFSRLYRENRISDIRLTVNLEWQKIALAAMRDMLLKNREKEINNPLYKKLKKELEAVETQLAQYREQMAMPDKYSSTEVKEKIRVLENRVKEIKQEIHLEKNRLYEAAVVLMDPKGRILASASYPYDEEALLELNPEIPKPYRRDANPHLNRAWQWKYNPGSTAKILDSIAFLYSRDRFPYLKRLLTTGSAFTNFPRTDLKGNFMLNGKEINFHLRNFEDHAVPPGFCSLTNALTHSYNTYFSYLALHSYSILMDDSRVYPSRRAFIKKSAIPMERMYREYPILELAEHFFMNRKINLLDNFRDSEIHAGLRRMPNDAFIAIESVFPVNAYTIADIAHYAIGQGDYQVTALQNAMVISTILNDGVLYLPSVVQSVTLRQGDNRPGKIIAPDPSKSKVRLYPAAIAGEIKEAMHAVVLRGTAWGVFGDLVRVKGRKFYAKTGTAETGFTKDNSLFTGFVCFRNNAHVIFSVIVPRSGLGARVAGKLTAQIIRGIIEYEARKGNML